EEEVARNPDAARAAVRKARDEALEALGELRGLSRGLRPALLEERGLRTAIEALVQRSAVPATLTLKGSLDDAPDAVSTAAYFFVAEALTNVNKHSGAASVDVTVERGELELAISIVDDGRGGANAAGSGIQGLRTRIRALDGLLELKSPVGGPTVLRAEIPCA
ncbi:MAG: histidine kinase, partial [Solirubrobacterales bacterium]|nr:histidine kinase [Solirubrobacterales bacterium]